MFRFTIDHIMVVWVFLCVGVCEGRLHPSSISGSTSWPQSFRERGGARPVPAALMARNRRRLGESRHWHRFESLEPKWRAVALHWGRLPWRGLEAGCPPPPGLRPPLLPDIWAVRHASAPSASPRCCAEGSLDSPQRVSRGRSGGDPLLKRHFIRTYLVAG